MTTVIPVVPVSPEIPRLQRRDARHNLESKNELYTKINDLYRQTSAYALKNRDDSRLLSGENSLWKRTKRWWNEKYVIVSQDKWELMNKIFTGLLLVLTLVLIIYSYKYELTLVSKDMIKTEINDDSKQKLDKYKEISNATDWIKGISSVYLISLISVRLFKRTTY